MGINYNTSIVTDGLVICLDGANPKSYPGSGSTWYDLSGNNNHCQWNVFPAFSSNYFTFTGTEYGTVTNNESLDFSSEQTVMMVLRHTYTSGRKNPWNQAYGGYGTWTHEGGSYLTSYFGDGGGNLTPYLGDGSASTPRDVWNIVAYTRNTSQGRWYINQVGETPVNHSYGTLTTTAANILIGRGYAGYWLGDMTFVAAYTKALSETEIKKNYAALRGRYGI